MTNVNDLPRTQFRKTEAAKRFHVNEDIFRSFASGQETETLDPVEPFYHGPFPVAFRRHSDMRALRKLGRMHCGAFVHSENAEGLQAAIPLSDFTNDPRTFIGSLIPVAAKNRYVKQNVRHAIIWNDKTITFGRIEPFYLTGDDCNVNARLFGCFSE